MSLTATQALGLIVSVMWLCGCARAGFDQRGRDGGIDSQIRMDGSYADGSSADGSSADGGPQDAGSDIASADLTADSPAGDSSASRQLFCASAVLVGSNQPAMLSSPAITPDGLKLVATYSNQIATASRPDHDSAFGSWREYIDPWAATPDKSDYAFFQHGGGVHAIVAVSQTGGDRSLHDCPHTASSCTEITIYGPSGTALTGSADLDGPTVAASLEMLISVDITGDPRAIYRAMPRDASLLEWDAEPLFVSPTGKIFDDASIAADGSLIVFPDISTTPNRIHYSFRGPGQSFGPIQEVMLDATEPSSPAIFRRPDGSYELFFDEFTAGGVYITRCL